MAEGWDLQAVVRGCSAAVNNTTNTTNFNTNMINNNGSNMQPLGDPLYEFASLAVQTQEDPFCFPNLFEKRNNNPFEELEQIYNPFFTTNIAPQFTPAYSISDLGGFQDQQQLIQQQQLQQPQQPQPQPQPQQQQQQQQQQIQFQKPRAAQTIGPPRPRRRKNQQARMVCQVTAECLSSDLWAWRKYGQKPIKGSPYPRNYYRCSSSKGCGARKQVERNAMDPNMFIVSYTGDHTHPRPTHRNSLAGSTRNKFTAPQISNSGDPQQLPIEKPSFSSPSPISTSSLSPTTPLSAPMDDELTAHQHEDKDAGIEEEENEEEMADFDIDDDDDILIPNMVMSEDIFMGFQELGGELPGSFQANSDSLWAPNSSATNTSTNAAGGGGC